MSALTRTHPANKLFLLFEYNDTHYCNCWEWWVLHLILRWWQLFLITRRILDYLMSSTTSCYYHPYFPLMRHEGMDSVECKKLSSLRKSHLLWQMLIPAWVWRSTWKKVAVGKKDCLLKTLRFSWSWMSQSSLFQDFQVYYWLYLFMIQKITSCSWTITFYEIVQSH